MIPGAIAAAAARSRSIRFRCTRRSKRGAKPTTCGGASPSFFAGRGWRVRERIFGGTEWSFADKHDWARRGVLVAHAGFVIVAAGTTLYWARGFAGEFPLLTGETTQIARTGAIVRLETISTIRIAPIMTKSGMVYQPVDYVSHVVRHGQGRRSQDDDGSRQPSDRYRRHALLSGELRFRHALQRHARRKTGREPLQPHASRRRLVRSSRHQSHGAVRALHTDRRQAAGCRAPTRESTIRPSRSVPPRAATPSAKRSFRCERGSTSATVGASRRRSTRCTADSSIGTTRACRWWASAHSCCSTGLIISFYFLPARLYVRVETAAPGRSRVGVAATTVKGYDVFGSEFDRLAAHYAASSAARRRRIKV